MDVDVFSTRRITDDLSRLASPHAFVISGNVSESYRGCKRIEKSDQVFATWQVPLAVRFLYDSFRKLGTQM
jgi:hypothetical protein